ncbi:MAG: hypothetical protein O2897_05990, partial [bacterium]|nr:hypothetical protein [bacterium]
WSATAFIFLGITGALCRRNLLTIFLCVHVTFLGIILLYASLIAINGHNEGFYIINIFILIFALFMLMAGALLVFVYRTQGTLNIDEIRQLRG